MIHHVLRSQAKMLGVSEGQSVYIYIHIYLPSKIYSYFSNIPAHLCTAIKRLQRSGTKRGWANILKLKNKIKPLFLGSKLPKFTERLKYVIKALSILQTVCKTTETPVKRLSMCLKVRVLNKLLRLFSLYIKIKAYEAKLGFGFNTNCKPSLKLTFFLEWHNFHKSSYDFTKPNAGAECSNLHTSYN